MTTQPDAWMTDTGSDYHPPTELNTGVAHPSRVYDFLLGGKDNFPADRAAGEAMLALGDEARTAARANRAALQRAVRHVAGLGIDQFLDIGTGIPTAGNTHQVAQQVNPDARVVYVDNDPIVLAHARALMSGKGHGATKVLQADLREVEAILDSEEVKALIDFTRPVALLLVAVLHFIPDGDDPHGIVARLLKALPSGSFLVLTHGTSDVLTEEEKAKVDSAYSKVSSMLQLRTRGDIARFFTGLDLVEPGLVLAPFWRPDTEPPQGSDRIGILAGVATKP
ncbi:SAM-dependent methyltransferase [Streptacidiphilus sp. PAMC 29251]